MKPSSSGVWVHFARSAHQSNHFAHVWITFTRNQFIDFRWIVAKWRWCSAWKHALIGTDSIRRWVNIDIVVKMPIYNSINGSVWRSTTTTPLYINIELCTKWPTTLANFMSSHIKNFGLHYEISIFIDQSARFTCSVNSIVRKHFLSMSNKYLN